MISNINYPYLSEYTTARSMSSVVGTIISFHPAMGVIVKFRSRVLQHDMEVAASWDLLVKLSIEFRSELLFWQNDFSPIPGKYMGVRKVNSLCIRRWRARRFYGGALPY